VSSTRVAPATTTFADLGVPADLIEVLAELQIIIPFDIQAEAIPDALAGRDIAGQAPTGSGKTLAFGLPLVARTTKAAPRRPRALVLAPTRELAAQTCATLVPLARRRRLWVHAFYGGVGFDGQRRALRRGVDIAVACPGRLADLVQRGEIDLSDVAIVVIDEADRMADMGFLPEVRRLLDRTNASRQTLLFSATLDGDVDVLVRDYQRDPVRHRAADVPAGPIEHRVHHVARVDRVRRVVDVLEHSGSSMVFVRTRHGADRLAQQLVMAGVSTATIHGSRSQVQRTRALDDFRAGRVRVLVATDVAARGIHVEAVETVIHFDLPTDAKDFVHRSGRTGRAGSAGVVVSLVLDEDRRAGEALLRSAGVSSPSVRPLSERPRHTAADRPQRSNRPRRTVARRGR
jgi:superfamily II DNA/RNA helicase